MALSSLKLFRPLGRIAVLSNCRVLSNQSRRPVTDAELQAFRRDGFVRLRNFYDRDEVQLLHDTVISDQLVHKHVMPMVDGEGMVSRLTLWNHAGDDTYGMFSRGQRMVEAAQKVVDGEVYHFHTKLMLKEPRVGGRWEWHQDFGYWYQVGCLQPEHMFSIMVAIDEATLENGCLEVLRGSHKLGRLDHGNTGEQAGANQARINRAVKLFKCVPAEMLPGDAFLLHSNTLHKSNANLSDKWRRCMIVAYNSPDNQPDKGTICPRYSPLRVVPDSAIKELGQVGRNSQLTDDFLSHEANVKQFAAKTK